MNNRNIFASEYTSNENTMHYFSKIKQNDLLSVIFTFLNISNIKNVIYINKRFKHHLLKEEGKLLKEIGHLSYGLNNLQHFPLPSQNASPSVKSTYISFKSNTVPILLMVLMENLSLLAITPSTFENDLHIWSVSQRKHITTIEYKDNNNNQRTYVYSMLYIEYLSYLVVSYSNKDVVVYQMNIFGESYFKWNRMLGVNKPITKFAYDDNNNSLYTLEINEDVALCFIKEYNIETGVSIKSSVVSNCIVLDMKILKMLSKVNESNAEENEIENIYDNYLVMSIYEIKLNEKFEIFNHSLKHTKLSITNINFIKGEFTEIEQSVQLYGHTAAIKRFIYNIHYNYLISCGVDLYIIIWDMFSKNAKAIVDSYHEDIIESITLINKNLFATCGKDRKICIWELNKNNTTTSNKILTLVDSFTKHQSDIYEIVYFKEEHALISGSFDKSVGMFYLDDKGKCKRNVKITGHSSNIKAAKFDFVNNILITSGMDNALNFWDLNSMNIIKSIDLVNNNKKEFFDDFIILCDDLNSIIKIDKTKTLKFFNPQTELFYIELQLPNPIYSILNLYDGISFAVGLNNGTIHIYKYMFEYSKQNIKLSKVLYLFEETELKGCKIIYLTYINFQKKMFACGTNMGTVCLYSVDGNKIEYKKIISSIYPKKDVMNIFEMGKELELIVFTTGDILNIYDNVNNKFKECNVFNVLTVEKMNWKYLAVSYKEENCGFFIYDVEKQMHLMKVRTSNNNNKIIANMFDGKKLLCVNGETWKGFGIDVVTIIFN